MTPQRVSGPLGDSTISFETGKIAKQAGGAVVVQQGETIVLVTAVHSESPSAFAAQNYEVVPLTVDYREKTSAAGRIPGGFFKREGRPSEKETLTARLIDRPIRPLLPHGLQHEVQVMATVLSSDGAYDPDVLAVVGASAALRLSPLPYPDETLGCVRIGMVNGSLIINPTYQQLTQSPMDMVVAGTRKGILAIEGGYKEVPEQQVHEAIQAAYDAILKLIELQEQLVKIAGKPKATDIAVRKPVPELIETIRKQSAAQLGELITLPTKDTRNKSRAKMLATTTQQLAPEGAAVDAKDVQIAFDLVEQEVVRRFILESSQRVGGRTATELRAISCEVGVLPRTHGSALFTRGETQSLATTTLGTSDDEQLVESLEGESYKRFMLHYNFPPFSVGEAKPIRSPGRREIGHGALAERALLPMIPTKDEFPYTIRVVSDILESNGSSSMASVCAGSLSLMDAGVPVKAAVAGVAMGLVKEGDRAIVLTDLSGIEDHFGDMDFKIAGTKLGITAVQVDVKLHDGLSIDLIKKIFSQAHPARMTVLDLMGKSIDKPREALSAYAPRITTIKINQEKIREVIGPGGRQIRKIVEDTGCKIDIADDGTISIASTSGEAADKAIAIIRGITEDPEVGKVYNGKVKRITSFGAFVEILPGKDGLVHVSQLAEGYVKSVEDVVKIGDEFQVKVIEIDEQGRINLSRKALLAPTPGGGNGDSEGRPPGGGESRRRGRDREQSR